MFRTVPVLVLVALLLGPSCVVYAEPVSSTPVDEPSEAVSDADNTLPFGTLQIGEHSARIPDWRMITFADFPAFSSGGKWGAVQWEAGDEIQDVLTLGDFQQDLQLQLLSIAGIGEKLGVEYRHGLQALSLDKFGLLKRQTLASLVAAVPSLAKESVSEVSLIEDLVLGAEPTLAITNLTVAELLSQFPEYGDISLSHLVLQEYQLGDLPGIEHVPLQAFEDWQEASISEIPLLENVSLWVVPNPPNLDGEIAMISIVTAEGDNAIPDDGGDFQIQLDSFEDSKRPLVWAIDAQEAGGTGSGELPQLGEGQEPLGATPYGSLFKVVPSQISRDGFSTVIYFRSCRQRSGGQSVDCSPYGIGPIPFMRYGMGEAIFLGQATFQPINETIDAPEPQQLEPQGGSAVEDFAETEGASSIWALTIVLVLGSLIWIIKGSSAQFIRHRLPGLRPRSKGRR